MDTMGQDREFTQDEKDFALNAVFRYREHWEKFEVTKLTEDRDNLNKEKDDDFEQFSEEKLLDIKANEEVLVDKVMSPEPEEAETGKSTAATNQRPTIKTGKTQKEDVRASQQTQLTAEEEEKNEFEEFEKKTEEVFKIKLGLMSDLLEKDEDFNARFKVLTSKKVVKHHMIIKSLFYLLGFTKEEICVPETQQFFWKKARHLWNSDLIEKMKNYQVCGKNEGDFKSYQSLNSVASQLEIYSEEELNRYNFSLGLIFKWMNLAIQARKKNILKRLYHSKILSEERDKKIEEEAAREEDKATKLQEGRDKWEKDNEEDIDKWQVYKDAIDAGEEPSLAEGEEPPTQPEYNENFFLHSYDEEFPKIAIPDQIVDDIDNDWDISEEKDALVVGYENEVRDGINPPGSLDKPMGQDRRETVKGKR